MYTKCQFKYCQKNNEVQLEIAKLEAETKKEKLNFKQNEEIVRIDTEKHITNYAYESKLENEYNEIKQKEKLKKHDILVEQSIKEAEVDKQMYVFKKEHDLKLAQEDHKIILIRKQTQTRLEELTKIEAIAKVERAQEKIKSEIELEIAYKNKEKILIEQETQSEKEKIAKQTTADALAYEIQKHAEAKTKAADFEKKAIIKLAEAELKKNQNLALGKKKVIEAKNLVKREILVKEILSSFIEKLPNLFEQAMKPTEKISDIKVFNINGMTTTDDDTGVNKVIANFVQTGAAIPLFKEMLKFANLDIENVELEEVAKQAFQTIPGVKEMMNKSDTIQSKKTSKADTITPKKTSKPKSESTSESKKIG